jgi:hypothetical protein
MRAKVSTKTSSTENSYLLVDLCVPIGREVVNSSIIKKPLWQAWRWVSLAEVRVQEGEPLENALRRFKRKVQQEDIIKEVNRHSY